MNSEITTWYNNFDKSKVNYLFNSGGRTQGNATRIRSDNNNTVTWAQASAAMGGKKIIADDGYGVGGSTSSDYNDWLSNSNINARISDGVIGLTVQDPGNDFTSFSGSNNFTIACGTTPVSSSSVSSSSVVSSSSSAVSSSSTGVSSSLRSSSSTWIAPSSSSSVTTITTYWSGNAQLSEATDAGIVIGQSKNWSDERSVTKILGTLTAAASYTLTFDIVLNANNSSMDVTTSLNTYCSKTTSVTDEATSVTCKFTASSNEEAVFKVTAPGNHWEPIEISNLSLVNASGSGFVSTTKFTYNATILLRAGRTLLWVVDKNATFQVFDLMGNKVILASTKNLDLSSLPSGVYLVQAKGISGKQIIRIHNP
jgi:hypothetical protein